MAAAHDFNFRMVRPGTADAQQVSSDLEDIFRAAPQPAADAAVAPRARPLTPQSPGRRERAVASLGLAAAAGLVGLAVGLVGLRHAPAPGIPTQAAALPAVVAQAAPVSVAPAAPVQVVPAAAATSARPRSSLHRAAAGAGLDRCAQLSRSAQARCAYPAMVAADRRLRAAYSHAVRSGVARPVLVDYRNRWASLRHQASYRPARTAMAYGELAGDLQRLARRGRS